MRGAMWLTLLGASLAVHQGSALLDRRFHLSGLELLAFSLQATSIVSMFLGSAVVIFCYLGLASCSAPRSPISAIFSAVLVGLCVAVFTLGVWLVTQERLQLRMEASIRELLARRSPEVRELLAVIQTEHDCCGAIGPGDYGEVPRSCAAGSQQGCGAALAREMRLCSSVLLGVAADVLVLLARALAGREAPR